MAAYDEAAAKLKAMGRLYAAYETAEELDRRRKRQQALGRPPIYDRAALRLSQADRAVLEASGRRPHWRFRLEPTTVRWDDLECGETHIDCTSLSDPVLRREDGSYLYTLPSVADDIDFGVTHVIRGEDHVTNTAVQIEIFEALAGAAPRFGHHNLLTDAGGGGCRSVQARCRSPRCGKGDRSARDGCARCAGRFGGGGDVRSIRSTNWRAWSTFPISPMARPVSTRQSSRRFRRARCIAGLTRRSLGGLPRLGSPARCGGPVARGSRQSLALRRRLRSGGKCRRRCRADRRGSRVPQACRLMRAGGRLGPVDLGRVDDAAHGTHRPQGARAVSSVAACADGPRRGPGARGVAAADRAG